MKKIFINFFFLIFFFNFNTSYSSEKIAFIDLDFVLKNSNIGKSILEDIEKLNNKNINELKKKESELKKNEEEILPKKNILSEEEYKKEVDLLKDKIKKYKLLKDDMVSDFQNKKQISLKNFFNQITPIIQNYMDENSINILLDRKNVFIGKTDSDITNSIIEKINKELKK
tara:strand:- start:206 stop:718 length:513 start_codon:yes stop_codon:yes gene_type:complete